MKCFLTSIGERTTELCRWQLEKLGFEVVLLDEKESWIDKYKKFIFMADKDCLRIDSDVIPNKNIKKLVSDCWMVQAKTYDLYRNDVWFTSPVFYSKEAIDLIRLNFDLLDKNRPETSAWRLIPKDKLKNLDIIVGIHGFFQDKETIERAKQNKINRGQIQDYYFELVEKIYAKDFY